MPRHIHRARGFNLLEVGMALSVTALALAGLNQLGSNATTQLKDQATAARLSQVYQAANSYMQANSATLIANPAITAGGGGTLAIAIGKTTAGAGIPPNSVQSGGFLPASFVDVNPYGQSHELLIQQPTPGNLVAIVTSYGGQPIKDNDLGSIGTKVGANGGFMMATPPPNIPGGTISGTFGGWSSAAAGWNAGAASPAVGHVMATLNQTAPITDYLDRYNIGVPDANRMHTNIDVNNQNLNNVLNTDTTTVGNTRGNAVTVQSNLDTTGDAQIQGTTFANQGVTIANSSAVTWSSFNGGIYMADPSWLRTYPNVGLYTNNGAILTETTVQANQAMLAPTYYDSTNAGYYMQPANWSNMNNVQLAYLHDKGDAQIDGNATVNCNINVAPSISGGQPNLSGCGNVFAWDVHAAGGLYSQQIIAAQSDIASVNGNIYANNGDITAIKGNIFTQTGYIQSANGLYNSNGDINNYNGNINNWTPNGDINTLGGGNVNAWNGGSLNALGGGNINAWGGQIIAVNGGNIQTQDQGGGAGYLITGGSATPGSPCGPVPSGAIAQSTIDGAMVFCTQGVWRSPGNSFGTVVAAGSFSGNANFNNSTGSTQFVSISATGQAHDSSISAYVGGNSVCQQSVKAGSSYTGETSCSFVVPPQTGFSVGTSGFNGSLVWEYHIYQ